MRSSPGTARALLAAVVLSLVAVEFSTLPRPYPTAPTVGPFPVNPELILPALLAAAVIVGALRGLGVGSVVTGLLGAVTLWIATTSLYEAYAATNGGVAWGAFFTTVSGLVLAVAVLTRQAVRRVGRPNVVGRLRTQLGE